MNEGPITREELIEMFGEAMAAVTLLWESPPSMTIGRLRAELREIAAIPATTGRPT